MPLFGAPAVTCVVCWGSSVNLVVGADSRSIVVGSHKARLVLGAITGRDMEGYLKNAYEKKKMCEWQL
jgi:hypothetical protein